MVFTLITRRLIPGLWGSAVMVLATWAIAQS